MSAVDNGPRLSAAMPPELAVELPQSPEAWVLLVEDDQLASETLCFRLKQAGYYVSCVDTARQALEVFAQTRFDIVLLDYGLPDGDGLDVLRRMLVAEPDVPVIMLTGQGSVHVAVEAMRAGAHHYLSKPFDIDAVLLIVRRALESTSLRTGARALSGSRRKTIDAIIGDSSPMVELKRLIVTLSRSPAATILITGETGTGKDLVARVLHDIGARAARPFLSLNCAAVPTTLLESELFGHERGAFTDARERKQGLFELAAGGTLFLDEIAELDPAAQSKLLHVLEGKRFRRVGGGTELHADVRVITATNQDLEQAVSCGALRQDLYYRLMVLPLRIPALRERLDDIGLLLDAFVERFSKEFSKPIQEVTASARDRLAAHSWPGNVRELRNAVERAVLLARQPCLDAEDFRILSSESVYASPVRFALPNDGIDLNDVERTFVQQALDRAGGNRTRAAALLGLTRDQIRYRIEKFRLKG